jgi:CheY-like chemotaxis protein
MAARILIVDDSWFQRLNIRNLLKADGYEFFEAASGEAALEIMAAEPPDVVLLDLVMPGMDGFAVLEAMQQQHIKIDTIIISADIQNTTRRRCLELGAKSFINKPLTEESGLPALVREFLSASKN